MEGALLVSRGHGRLWPTVQVPRGAIDASPGWLEVALGELGGDSMFAGDPIFQRSAQLAKLNWLASGPGCCGGLWAPPRDVEAGL